MLENKVKKMECWIIVYKLQMASLRSAKICLSKLLQAKLGNLGSLIKYNRKAVKIKIKQNNKILL